MKKQSGQSKRSGTRAVKDLRVSDAETSNVKGGFGGVTAAR